LKRARRQGKIKEKSNRGTKVRYAAKHRIQCAPMRWTFDCTESPRLGKLDKWALSSWRFVQS
jgi:hypothetical protein